MSDEPDPAPADAPGPDEPNPAGNLVETTPAVATGGAERPAVADDPGMPHPAEDAPTAPAPADDDLPPEDIDQRPGEQTVPGGRFIRGATIRGGKPYGGEIVNAHGVVLARFDARRHNTGDPEHGEVTKAGRRAMKGEIVGPDAE